MKKTVLTFLSILSFSGFLNAQTSPEKGFKVYLNAFSEHYNFTSFDDNGFSSLNHYFSGVGHLSLGYAKKSNHAWWKEFEVGYTMRNNYDYIVTTTDSTGFQQISGGNNNITRFLSSRYEVYRNIISNDRIAFLLGISGQAYWLNSSFIPSTSSQFPSYYNKLGLNVAAVPRLQFYFERFAIDVNMPLRITNSFYAIERVENPTLTRNEQTSYNGSYQLLDTEDMVQGRIGLFWYL